jgi:putative endopeptidase
MLDAQLRDANLDPDLARGEAIADLVGMRVALRALRPGANHMRFFETWARLWRVKSTKAHVELERKMDPHASGWARTVLPLRNFKEFHDAYGVVVGDRMWLEPDARVEIF